MLSDSQVPMKRSLNGSKLWERMFSVFFSFLTLAKTQANHFSVSFYLFVFRETEFKTNKMQ